MRVARRARYFACLAPLLLAGCPNSFTLTQQNQALVQQQQQLAMQNQELARRAELLDQDNQQRNELLAQSRQQIQLLKDELIAVRDQLRDSNNQLADLKSEREGLRNQTEALAASIKRRASATIEPNNSLIGELTAIKIPGVEVRQDGDVIRIELPGEKLFYSGGASLQPQASQLVDGVMADVMRNYPNQVIGVEGHTDSDPVRTSQFPTNHHLSVARAMAVYDHAVGKLRIPSGQLFVVGHGSNHPVVSNATPAGKARNRRVEIVVYPEQNRAQ